MRTVKITKNSDCQRFTIPTEKDWGDLACYVSSLLGPGSVVAVSGPLGAGKTTFVQALGRELGVKKTIQSPTFALMRSYHITPPAPRLKRLIHLDAYRIDDERDLLPLDLDEELADGQTALVIEWPEKIKKWLRAKQRSLPRGKFLQLKLNHPKL